MRENRFFPQSVFLIALFLFIGCKEPLKEKSITQDTPVVSRPTSNSLPSTTKQASQTQETPDSVSKASPVYEEGPSVLVSGTVDGKSLREKNRVRLSNNNAPVTLLKGESALELGEKICEDVVPNVPKKTPILLKPNIGGFDWFKNPKKHNGDNGIQGRITDPEFVRGVIHCLQKRGYEKITVAEGWGATHEDWKRLIKVSGYEAMTKEEGVPLVAMDDDGVFDVEGDKPGKPLGISGIEDTLVPTLLMPKILAEHLDHGLFISLPKIKAHRFGVFSIAIKGMQGTVMYSNSSPAFRQKWRSHRELGPYLAAKKKGLSEDREAYIAALEIFSQRMADVLEIETPHVVLAEGAPAMSGDGFQVLTPSAENIAIGGENPILVDRVGAEFLGLWKNESLAKELGGHETSPLLEVAAERFSLDLERFTLEGNGKALLQSPRPVHFVAMAPFTISSQESSSKEEKTPTAYATYLTDSEPVIDGKGDESVWKKASELSWETNYKGEKTGIVTHVRFLWSDEALYALFILENTDFFVDQTRSIETEREGLYKEDCVEIFLTPDPAYPERYYEIELGPYGHWFDIFIDRNAKPREDISWSSGLTVATSQNKAERSAIIEVKLSSPDLRQKFEKNAELPLGLFRMEGKSPRSYLAWSPAYTAKPKFHIPEAFGRLVLKP